MKMFISIILFSLCVESFSMDLECDRLTELSKAENMLLPRTFENSKLKKVKHNIDCINNTISREFVFYSREKSSFKKEEKEQIRKVLTTNECDEKGMARTGWNIKEIYLDKNNNIITEITVGIENCI